MSKTIYDEALAYHLKKPYGKLGIKATKSLVDQKDLALAYSPGVAEPCRRIQADPDQAAYLTSRGNLIAVISNGTAVLGLGNIGALASKPVMEGKAVLFKKFSGIDAFDIEINETDPDKLIDIIASLEPTFGGINLEDIKAPECFYIENELKKRLNIPVIHDDQHGTAIVTCAALENALKLTGKNISTIKLVCHGAGAAAIACLNLLCLMGLQKENIFMLDRKGVISLKRLEIDQNKNNYARETDFETLTDVMKGCDVFLGLSSENVVTKDMVLSMAANPIIFALANPEPEISPHLVKEVRQDAIIATGRSDFPNQVNNAVCYPYLFRGALDVGATVINNEMKLACVHAIAKLARETVSDQVANAYGGVHQQFGSDYIIPKPFDSRLYVNVSLAVAQAAMSSGVAKRPIACFDTYKAELDSFVYRSFHVMRPIFDMLKNESKESSLEKLVFAEGEDKRVLQAVQQLVDNGVCHHPILIGRPEVIESRIKSLHLPLNIHHDITIVNNEHDERFYDYWNHYHDLMGRFGVSPSLAKLAMRTNTTAIASMMVKRKDADGMICGVVNHYHKHFDQIKNVIGLRKDINKCYSLCVLVHENEALFFTDPYIVKDPNVEDLVEMTQLSIKVIERFKIEPKIALLSHSAYGMFDNVECLKMKKATQLLQEKFPNLQIDGEMQVDAALLPDIREQYFKNSPLKDAANLFVMPNIDAAHIAYMMAKSLDQRLTIDPILMGLSDVAHIANNSISVRGLVNLASYAISDIKYNRKI
jgi:malate dehydrogenase (oxaloacetate-decarboxylating)(NADP+)